MRNMLTDFGLAWRLLTVIPLPLIPEDFNRPAGKAAGYYPLVGLIIGLILAGLDGLFQWLWPGHVAATLTLAVWVGLTGMLHLDGFMDACDGLLPPRDRARRLEIMKDSRVGAFGVVGGILLLLLKFNSLAALPAGTRWAALLAAPVLARWAVTWVMACYPLAGKEGLGVLFVAGISRQQVVTASIIAAATVAVAFGAGGLLLIIIAWLSATLIATFAVAQIGGLTGDIYGATCETTETILLLTVLPTATLFSSLSLTFL